MTPTLKQEFGRATNLLLDDGIPLIEWGDQVLRSYGYPAVTSVYDFIVPDPLIDRASTLLDNAGFRRMEPNISLQCFGVFGIAGYLYASRHDTQQWPIRLHLLPESLVHLSIRDTDPIPSRFDPTHTFHRPRLPEHCVSLVRCLEDYPRRSLDRAQPERHLLILFVAGAFKQRQFGKLWAPEEETESEKDFLVRQSAAIREIEAWTLAREDEPYRSKLVDILISDSSAYFLKEDLDTSDEVSTRSV